ncbi:hypothetical protein NFI96_002608 [Prochilodus magdalenae]|nr:hypothetical protein NFI96_002608 [Prochilodus magdalenae]
MSLLPRSNSYRNKQKSLISSSWEKERVTSKDTSVFTLERDRITAQSVERVLLYRVISKDTSAFTAEESCMTAGITTEHTVLQLQGIHTEEKPYHCSECGKSFRENDLDPKIHDQIKAVFIFDGLDESRIPMDFEECERVSDITMTSSVGVLMTNLIKGELLPSALIWITSRPAAANQIPPKNINRVTEIQGFSEPQKEEYFRKRISDEDQARRIISHIKTVRSLHTMCHIPVFCWISATVLQQIMRQGSTEIPRTLNEMYSHFLLTQTHMKNEKYEKEDETDPKNLLKSNRTILLKLAELAFKQLMKGNVMFYEEDLRESRIDVTDALSEMNNQDILAPYQLSEQETIPECKHYRLCYTKLMRGIQRNSSMMELHQSSSGGGTSDPAVKHRASTEPSCVSMKSDRSIGDPPSFSRGGGEPNCVSMKSDRSIGDPPSFSRGGGEPSCVSMKSDRSIGDPPSFSRGGGEPNCVSMKSDRSIGDPPSFSRGGGEPNCVSMKSDRSIGDPPSFSRGGGEPGCVSMKSNGAVSSDPEWTVNLVVVWSNQNNLELDFRRSPPSTSSTHHPGQTGALSLYGLRLVLHPLY